MPLDTGAVTHNLLASAGVDMSDAGDVHDGAIEGALDIGGALRSTRQRLGLSLQDVADATRIKRAYLSALEEMRLEDLPSRPFTIGYVRAYARTLGLDGDAAVERFKLDAPGAAEPLRPPVGVRKHKDARVPLLACGGAAVISAVILWNVAQHAMADDTPPPPLLPESAAPAAPVATATPTLPVSAAQPAPQDSDLPQTYKTPGMQTAADPADPAGASTTLAAASDSPTAPGVPADPAAPKSFTPHGAVYGAAAQGSAVILQARKSASLVIRGADGSVYFAQQLKAGEAYRAPAARNLTVDVSDRMAFDVYLNGQLHAALPAAVTPLSQLMAAAAAPADPGA